LSIRDESEVQQLAIGTVAKRVPQTVEQADKVVARIRRRREQNDTDQKRIRELTAETKRLRAKVGKRDEANEADQFLVQAFADAHRDELTKGGRKSFFFPSGAIGQWGYPQQGTLVVVGNLGSIARALLRLPNWELFLKIELRKNNIKAHLEELRRVSPTLRKGLREDKQERFMIKT